MEIIRKKGMETGFDYEFLEDNKILKILFGGNLDLYWSLETNKDFSTYEEMIKPLYETFTITKENYQIYSLFKMLIDDVRNANVYTPMNEYVMNEYDEIESLPPSEIQKEETKKRNEELKKEAGYQRLVKDNYIEWRSDDEAFDIADILRISEVDENIVLEFFRPEIKGEKFSFRLPSTITIRFRNSGSYYLPFNAVFMKHFNKLQEFNPEEDKEYHQIHFEEIAYQLMKK